ncbi:MAG: sn-glycerol-3-phosphate ABC transporter substrate-binding protein UgpB [Burkholderiaceae bacterium]|jgi:sn-glycerol 3-phosphate transport system substrate-binding protein
MNPRRFATRTAFAALLLAASGSAFSATEIFWWHSMAGPLGDRVVAIANKFNAQQTDYKVTPVYKGQYAESMTAAIAAFRAGNAPHILQVFEVGTATMMAAKGAVIPVYKLMADTGEKFDPQAYIAPVAGYYSDPSGKMLSMPFNSSTVVFYYNKDAFKKAGLPADKAPSTWPEVEADARKIKAAGFPCAFTTGWQSWAQLENFSAWHNVPFATKEDGLGGIDARVVFNGPLQVRHIENLARWAKEGLFTYAGRTDEPLAKFTSGECQMLMTSSGSYANIKVTGKFEFGVAPMPYYPDVKGAPQNAIIGGASLWVMSGKKPEEYKGVAKFLAYLSSLDNQVEWHEGTGYVPITNAAYDAVSKSGFYKEKPGFDVAVKELMNKPPTENSRGLRLGNFLQIRNIIDEELELVWSGNKTAKQALDAAVERSNEILQKFEKTNS